MTFTQSYGNFPEVHSVFEKNGNKHYLTSKEIQQLVFTGGSNSK